MNDDTQTMGYDGAAGRAGDRDICEWVTQAVRAYTADARAAEDAPPLLRAARRFGEIGVDPWVGVVLGLMGSVDELRALAKRRGEVIDEAQIRPLFLDIVEHAVAGLILFEEGNPQRRSRDAGREPVPMTRAAESIPESIPEPAPEPTYDYAEHAPEAAAAETPDRDFGPAGVREPAGSMTYATARSDPASFAGGLGRPRPGSWFSRS